MTALTEEKPTAPASVDTDEMGFAIALFVAAANGKVAVPNTGTAGVHLSRSSKWNPDALLTGARSVLMDEEDKFGDEIPLARAVSVIWHHYESDQRRQVICSRLIAFYSLMIRSNGALLEPWTHSNEGDAGSLFLTSAIVEAVATARLGHTGQFVDSEFESLVRKLTERDAVPSRVLGVSHTAGTRIDTPSLAPIPVTTIVKELATHLFAFQACVAAVPSTDGSPHFRVLDRLCAGFGEMSGNRGLQPILSRALLAGSSEFAWLRSARASAVGTVEGLDEIKPAPSVQDAARAELVVLGSLVELLRCFVGDAVTLQLLRTIWPLASFHSAVSSKQIDL